MSAIIKHICDMCGRELAYCDKWSFNIKEKRKICGFKYSKPQWSTERDYELCRECGDALENFIDQRKKEFNVIK